MHVELKTLRCVSASAKGTNEENLGFFQVETRDTSGTGGHFQDERIECIYVLKNMGKYAEYRTCKAPNPGKKGPEIIECFKE